MRGENSLGISWEDLEDEDVDPLELEGLPCKPTTSEKNLSTKDRSGYCNIKTSNTYVL